MAPASRPSGGLLVPLLTLSVFTILLSLSSTAHGEISTLSKGMLLTRQLGLSTTVENAYKLILHCHYDFLV